jgi:hypothetical protein
MPKRFCCETVSCGTFERLEPDEGKLSRPVLRGGGDGDVASLPGGETLSSSGEGSTSYGFAGEWMDSYIELLYLRSRMYSPYLIASQNARHVGDYGVEENVSLAEAQQVVQWAEEFILAGEN